MFAYLCVPAHAHAHAHVISVRARGMSVWAGEVGPERRV